MILVSTTYPPKKRTHLNTILSQLSKLKIDGVELGSTHIYNKKKYYLKIIKKFRFKKLFIHNFFPPLRNKDFVINIASSDKNIRKKSINFIKSSIRFCKLARADLYTFHPGFIYDAKPQTSFKNNNYNFFFYKNYHIKKPFSLMITSLKEIVSYAKKNKVRIAIESGGTIHKEYKNHILMQKPNEFFNLFKIFPKDLFINFNLPHSIFASITHNFSLKKFIKDFSHKIVCVEISHNNKLNDQHLYLKNNSYVLKYLKFFKNIPIILELRNCNIHKLKKSIKILEKYERKNN